MLNSCSRASLFQKITFFVFIHLPQQKMVVCSSISSHLHISGLAPPLFPKEGKIYFSERVKRLTRTNTNWGPLKRRTCCSVAPLDATISMQPPDIDLASDGVLDSIQRLVLADLDPSSAKLAIGVLGPVLSAFAFLFILRIVMSWYPKLPVGKFPYVIAYAPTEPILFLTRKVIPPLGGVDVTPVVWFGLVSFTNEILLGPQGLLVLLSQQVK